MRNKIKKPVLDDGPAAHAHKKVALARGMNAELLCRNSERGAV